jgi:hypothetical protein
MVLVEILDKNDQDDSTRGDVLLGNIYGWAGSGCAVWWLWIIVLFCFGCSGFIIIIFYPTFVLWFLCFFCLFFSPRQLYREPCAMLWLWMVYDGGIHYNWKSRDAYIMWIVPLVPSIEQCLLKYVFYPIFRRQPTRNSRNSTVVDGKGVAIWTIGGPIQVRTTLYRLIQGILHHRDSDLILACSPCR